MPLLEIRFLYVVLEQPGDLDHPGAVHHSKGVTLGDPILAMHHYDAPTQYQNLPVLVHVATRGTTELIKRE